MRPPARHASPGPFSSEDVTPRAVATLPPARTMLSFTPAAVLVLLVASGELWRFLRAAGEKNLKTPQNVSVEIVDHNFILKWNWDNEPNSNVTFSAYYQKISSSKMSDWIELIGCQKVTGTKCDFTSTNLKAFEKIRLRIRSEKGQETSPWYNVTQFVPFQIGTVKSNMWATHISSFIYSLIIWKNSSSVEETSHTVYSGDKINNLSPETTYCLKVQAILPIQKKSGSYSPILCINTTAEHKLPRPENVEVDAVNNYVLKWDYPYENINFQVQYLLGYYKRIPSDYSDKWKTLSNCKNITSRHCDFSREITTDGIYYLRVQASNGTITSLWSAERKFDTRIHTRRGPPSIIVKPDKDSLSVYISIPGESEKKPISQDYPLIYEVTYWENASNIENKVIVKEKLFTVSDLKPLALYCFKVKALLEDEKSNKYSQFSNVECKKITPDEQGKSWIAGICFVFIIILIFIAYCLKHLLKGVKSVFYPSCKPPSNMGEWFSDLPSKHLLVISEEPTESCVIEKINNTVLEETNQNGINVDICSKQDNQDSGNYSNEDETSGNKMTEKTLQQETVQQEAL
ncbi:interferon alpha/beta receptor 1 isoform X2 [Petaurus breviceps papuanus]|uniref:interferon alpha/beta receptor 1 isoform X2 n=1 Tax=Petaurus breviceps papuanus TaxID=3040969 RepID=UPI0036DE7D6B